MNWFLTRLLHGLVAIVSPMLALHSLSGYAEVKPLVTGDERLVETQHEVALSQGTIRYRTVVGRLPIRDDSGQVRGYAFFTSYVAPQGPGRRRPIAFIWNGGPGSPSTLLHMRMFGPKRLDGNRLVPNDETLLAYSDLVFFDPIGTGFSRPTPAADPIEFYSVLGDFAETEEFIRVYRARFQAGQQPMLLVGESYGTWRVAGVIEALAKKNVDVAGAILISGGIPGSLMGNAFEDAMAVPARTATAFYFKKLTPELMVNRERTIAAAERWAHDVYLPRLDAIATLTPSERETTARQLAEYTGLDPKIIDRTSLIVTNNQFRSSLLGLPESKALNPLDMRIKGDPVEPPEQRDAIMRYIRTDLGYDTGLAYLGEEVGYTPYGKEPLASPGDQWVWNHVERTPAMLARSDTGAGPEASQPWLQRAMLMEPRLRVFVAAGRYDGYNTCAGNHYRIAKLTPQVAKRFSLRCYDGGHMMYMDGASIRRKLSQDINSFVLQLPLS